MGWRTVCNMAWIPLVIFSTKPGQRRLLGVAHAKGRSLSIERRLILPAITVTYFKESDLGKGETNVAGRPPVIFVELLRFITKECVRRTHLHVIPLTACPIIRRDHKK